MDSHELIALARRVSTFISYGIPARGDANWLDQQGSYMATIAAGPVCTLLGAHDLGVGDDYRDGDDAAGRTRTCSRASSPGGSTKAAIPTRRT